MKKISYILTALVYTILSALCVYADTKDLKTQQNEAKSNAAEARSDLNQTRQQISNERAAADRLDEQLNIAQDDLDFISKELEKTTVLLAQTTVELNEAAALREQQYDTYKKRVRYMYEHGTTGYLDVVLKASSVSDFLNRAEYVNKIAEYDSNLVSQMRATEALVAEKLEETEKQKHEQEFLQSQQQAKTNELSDMLASKQALLKQLSAREDSLENQVSEYEAESQRIERLIKAAEAEAARKAEEARRAAAAKNAPAPAKASYTGGKVGWPLPSSSNITSRFVARKNPVTGKSEFHKGIDIAAPYGSDIVAAEGGTVISAVTGWGGGYGNNLVISHGNGLSTLYGHCSKLLVSSGTVVKKGQVIAKVGSTGNSTGNHLHFEVRVNGVPNDPMPYVR
ncbi:peptidase M23 [Clostridia bacterium]|nr:peptidase M23 [Clostridia bacterium]